MQSTWQRRLGKIISVSDDSVKQDSLGHRGDLNRGTASDTVGRDYSRQAACSNGFGVERDGKLRCGRGGDPANGSVVEDNRVVGGGCAKASAADDDRVRCPCKTGGSCRDRWRYPGHLYSCRTAGGKVGGHDRGERSCRWFRVKQRYGE
jgi:hypothetical protein